MALVVPIEYKIGWERIWWDSSKNCTNTLTNSAACYQLSQNKYSGHLLTKSLVNRGPVIRYLICIFINNLLEVPVQIVFVVRVILKTVCIKSNRLCHSYTWSFNGFQVKYKCKGDEKSHFAFIYFSNLVLRTNFERFCKLKTAQQLNEMLELTRLHATENKLS